MNTLDLTKTGGFPFTQDMLDWVQQNSLAVMNMLGAKLLPDSLANTANTPVALVGINPGTTQIYKAGWLWYNNEILHFPTDIDASGLPTLSLGSGLVYGFSIQEVDTPVAYFDGSSHNTKISRTVTIASGVNAITATFIPLTTTIYYFGNGLKETSWNTLSGTPPAGITPTIKYRKHFLSNTVELDIYMLIDSAALGGPFGGVVLTLPVGYRPMSTYYFAGIINPPGGIPYLYDNQTPTAPIVAIPIWIDTSGNVNIKVVPSNPSATYPISLRANIALD